MKLLFAQLSKGYWKTINSVRPSLNNYAMVIIVLMLCHLAIALPLAAFLNIWNDEVYTLNTTGRDLAYAFHQAIYFEEQSPLYFLLLNLWRQLNSSIFFARLFSVFCTLATIYAVALILRQYNKKVHPAWVILPLVFHPSVIWASVEARHYAFSTLLASLLILLFPQGYLSRNNSHWIRVLYISTSVMALYTYYFLGFLLLAHALFLIWKRKLQGFQKYTLDMIIVVLFSFPSGIFLLQTLHLKSDVYLERRSWLSLTREMVGGLLQLFLPTQAEASLPSQKQSFLQNSLRYAFFMPYVWFLCKRKVSANSDTLPFNLTFFASALLLFFGILLIGISPSLRYLYFLVTLAYLFIVSSILTFRKPYKSIALSVWLSFSLIFIVSSDFSVYSPVAKWGDYIRVASYIERYEGSKQPILFFNPEAAAAFQYHYKGLNQVFAIPKELDFVSFTGSALSFKDEQEIMEAVLKLKGHPPYLWLAMTIAPHQERQRRLLEAYFSRNYSVLSSRDFLGTNVKVLKLNSTD